MKELLDLVGIHTFSAIGRETGNGDLVCLELDGKLYLFESYEGDGYRDSLDKVTLVEVAPMPMVPICPSLVVEARYRDKSDRPGIDGVEALYLIDERTGLVVLDIGTDNVNDYYPMFIFQWQPEGWTPEWLTPE